MADFYQFLARKITEVQTDPVKLRELVYEATRLALERPVNANVGFTERWRHLMDLDAAISRLESDLRRLGTANGWHDDGPSEPVTRHDGPALAAFDVGQRDIAQTTAERRGKDVRPELEFDFVAAYSATDHHQKIDVMEHDEPALAGEACLYDSDESALAGASNVHQWPADSRHSEAKTTIDRGSEKRSAAEREGRKPDPEFDFVGAFGGLADDPEMTETVRDQLVGEPSIRDSDASALPRDSGAEVGASEAHRPRHDSQHNEAKTMKAATVRHDAYHSLRDFVSAADNNQRIGLGRRDEPPVASEPDICHPDQSVQPSKDRATAPPPTSDADQRSAAKAMIDRKSRRRSAREGPRPEIDVAFGAPTRGKREPATPAERVRFAARRAPASAPDGDQRGYHANHDETEPMIDPSDEERSTSDESERRNRSVRNRGSQATPSMRGESEDSSEGQVRASRSRQLIIPPERDIALRPSSVYLVSPDMLARRDEYLRHPRPFGRTLTATVIGSQLLILVVAGVALYFAISGRAALPSHPGGAAVDEASLRPASTGRVDDAGPRPYDGTPGPIVAALPAAAAAEPAFALPAAYGVYAINNKALIELDQVPTAPVDPRTRSTLQIVKPSHTIIMDPKLSFVVYRRDLVTTAPDKVSVRKAARIARSMTFDSNGKAVTAPPPTDTWLIREVGYDLRVSPLRESPEMVLLRPENESFEFPPGRYELILNGQPYDFTIDGPITDPAQCVEGVATGRGPAFYECRTQ